MIKRKYPEKRLFQPKNKEKYSGKTLPICRSKWEYKFCHYLDNNPNVLNWLSEEPKIPYINPNTGTVWKYHPDFLVKIKEGDTIKIKLIEIKPFKQTLQPKASKGKRKSTLLKEEQTYAMNSAKWQAAKEFCKKKGWDFLILTEKELF